MTQASDRTRNRVGQVVRAHTSFKNGASYEPYQLASLHTAIIDARAGYGKAIEQSEDPGALDRLRAVNALHQSAHTDIHRMLGSHGEPPDDDGSLMGSLHKAVVATRSAILGLDDASLASFASGEESNLKAHDEAIAEMVAPSQRAIRQEHRDALAAKVAAMKHQVETAGTTIIREFLVNGVPASDAVVAKGRSLRSLCRL